MWIREFWSGPAPGALAETYDFIIVGGGTAGCVLANRLSADPNVSVLLVEATDRDTATRPGGAPEGMGFSPGLSGMVYLRGHRMDYENWAAKLGPGWTWGEMLPLFRELEAHHQGATQFHGAAGDWKVEGQNFRWEILESVRRAAIQAGIAPTSDFNAGDNEGCGYFEVNQRWGAPVSAADALLRPVAHRSNLSIIFDSFVERIGLVQGRATSIDVLIAGHRLSLRVRREVLLAAGAIGTPCILQRSGIGPGPHLQALGIPVVRDLAAGCNLQDHAQIPLIFSVNGASTRNTVGRTRFGRILMGLEHALQKRGPLAACHLGILTRSSSGEERADIQFNVQPFSVRSNGDGLDDFPAITLSACNLRPESRGSVLIADPSPASAPRIDAGHLREEKDRKVAVRSLKLARRIMEQQAMWAHLPFERSPGSCIQSVEQLLEAMACSSDAVFNPVGTCRMGVSDDAVVGIDFKVIGMEGLRVVDASVMPEILSATGKAATAAIALKACKQISVDANLDPAGGSMHPFDLFKTAVPMW